MCADGDGGLSKSARKARSKKQRRATRAILKHGRSAAPTHKKLSGRTGSGLKGREHSVRA